MRHGGWPRQCDSREIRKISYRETTILLTRSAAFSRFLSPPGANVRINSIEIRVCRNTQPAMSDSEMRTGGKSTFDFLVITMKTDDGLEAHSMGFAGRGAEMAGEIAASALKPFFVGKDP